MICLQGRSNEPGEGTPGVKGSSANTISRVFTSPHPAAGTRPPSPGRSGYRAGRGGLHLILADEFGATLDRLTAAVIARNIRKWTRRNRHICFIAATTHDDLLESLDPDVLIEKHLGSEIDVLSR